jgi:hypothetical protein
MSIRRFCKPILPGMYGLGAGGWCSKRARDWQIHKVGKPEKDGRPSSATDTITNGLLAVQRVIQAIFRKTPEFRQRFSYLFLSFWSCELDVPFVWDAREGGLSIDLLRHFIPGSPSLFRKYFFGRVLREEEKPTFMGSTYFIFSTILTILLFPKSIAIASLLILGINIVGGFLIGVLQFDMGLAEAAKRFTLLTVGDGLVTAIPSLLISVAGAMTS